VKAARHRRGGKHRGTAGRSLKAGSQAKGNEPPAHGSARDLADAERLLVAFGSVLPNPTDQKEVGAFYAALLGRRAQSLYLNFLHSLGSPTDVGPIIALRPLVEATIVLKWISLDPAVNGLLWQAHSEGQDLKAAEQAEKHLGDQVHGTTPLDVIADALSEKRRARDAAKQVGAQAGREYGARVMPSLERMVEEVELQDPGHRTAMRQAYEGAYRAFSPWIHTEASSFKATAEQVGDTVRFIGDRTPYRLDHLRIIAGAMYAYALEVVGIAAGTGSEVPTRFIRDYLTIHMALPGADGPSDS
jgi:Family of unknown function (DUF5677)